MTGVFGFDNLRRSAAIRVVLPPERNQPVSGGIFPAVRAVAGNIRVNLEALAKTDKFWEAARPVCEGKRPRPEEFNHYRDWVLAVVAECAPRVNHDKILVAFPPCPGNPQGVCYAVRGNGLIEEMKP